MIILIELLFALFHLVVMIALPVAGAVNVVRRSRITGYLFLLVTSSGAGLAGAMWFTGGTRIWGGLAVFATSFLFGTVAGESGRAKQPFSPMAFRVLVFSLTPMAAGIIGYAVMSGPNFYPSILRVMQATLNEAFELQKSRGLVPDEAAFQAVREAQEALLPQRAYMAPGLALAGTAAWIALCLVQLVRFAGVWSREDLFCFRLPEWVMAPALLLGLVTAGFGLTREWDNHYHVAVGYLYFAAVPYLAQGMAVSAVLFRKLGIPVWLTYFAVVTLSPLVLGAGIADLWADFRTRLAKPVTSGGSGDQ